MTLIPNRINGLLNSSTKLLAATLIMLLLSNSLCLAEAPRNAKRMLSSYTAAQKRLLKMKLDVKLLKGDELVTCETHVNLDTQIKCLKAKSKTEKALAKVAAFKLPISPLDFNKDGKSDDLDKSLLAACLAQGTQNAPECASMDLNNDKKLSLADGVEFASISSVLQFLSGINCS